MLLPFPYDPRPNTPTQFAIPLKVENPISATPTWFLAITVRVPMGENLPVSSPCWDELHCWCSALI